MRKLETSYDLRLHIGRGERRGVPQRLIDIDKKKSTIYLTNSLTIR